MERSTRRTPSKSGKQADHASRIVGKTRDGVLILRPKARPKHFTSEQIRATISEVVKSKPGKARGVF